jgi:hypothetical protein
LFGSCNIHILYTGYAKIKKNNSGAKGLTDMRNITRIFRQGNLKAINQTRMQKCGGVNITIG